MAKQIERIVNVETGEIKEIEIEQEINAIPAFLKVEHLTEIIPNVSE